MGIGTPRRIVLVSEGIPKGGIVPMIGLCGVNKRREQKRMAFTGARLYFFGGEEAFGKEKNSGGGIAYIPNSSRFTHDYV